jgi:endonuclease YncB( thermonuclease family)
VAAIADEAAAILRALLLFCLALWAGSASAALLSGEVVGIADGDTLTVLDSQQTPHKIRLAGIDAPEKRQPFGQRSRQSLAALVFRKRVAVQWHKRDRYGRVIGKVLLDGRDVNLAQLDAGLAWHYKDYQRDQAPADRQRYAQAEERARAQQAGLWREAAPLAPWEFRRQGRRHGD